MDTLKTLLSAVLFAGLAGLLLAGDDDKKDDKKEKAKPVAAGTLVVTDSSGKEHVVKNARFTVGLKKLTWLDQAEPDKDKKASTVPEALMIRQGVKFNLAVGVETLIPLERVRSVAFDSAKETMTVVAVGDKDEEVSLVGSTKYKGINKITLKAEIDKGEDGVIELTYQGGILKGGIKGIRFPTAKPEASKAGRPAVVQTADKDVKRTHKVDELRPLYVSKGREKTSSLLFFQKTLKLDVSKVKKITVPSEASDDIVWQVTTKDEESSLTLITSPAIDGQKAQLLGFVGRVPVGFEVFPLARIAGVAFDTNEEPKEEKDDKKEEKDKKDEKDKKKLRDT